MVGGVGAVGLILLGLLYGILTTKTKQGNERHLMKRKRKGLGSSWREEREGGPVNGERATDTT